MQECKQVVTKVVSLEKHGGKSTKCVKLKGMDTLAWDVTLSDR